MSARFKPLGQYVYEKGERIGCSLEEAAVELSRKLNAYQMRIERLKAEVERLRKAGDAMQEDLLIQVWPWNRKHFPSIKAWNAAKEGRPNE